MTSPVSLASQTAPWSQARAAAYAGGAERAAPVVELPLAAADGAVLADPLTARTDLPAFPTSSVDGWAVRGPAPWRIVGRLLAGVPAQPLTQDGTCVQIATGAMVPAGTGQIVRVEDSTVDGDLVSGVARALPEWREPGDECRRGEVLLPAGTTVNPGTIGLAASCGYDTLRVRPGPRAALLVFGDELLTSGLSGGGRIRDALGPALPGWLRRLGAMPAAPIGPIEDTLEAHVAAVRGALAEGVPLICTTGGTMHGPVDHLHATLRRLDATYVVNTVGVRPGFPMLLATVPRPDGGAALLAGLPGNPQSAIIALLTLVAPALHGLRGTGLPILPRIRLAALVPGRDGHTHLALVRRGADGLAYPIEHVGSAMLRGLAQAIGFAVIPPETSGSPGDEVELLPLPLLPGELP